MESYALGGPPPLDSSTNTLEFGGPYKEGGDVVVVVVGDVVVEDEGAGVSTKYAAIPAMMRITTMTITVEVVLIALCLMIFILGFHKPS